MTIKRSLENRIRGWLPHEPTMISTRLKVNHEYMQPPPIIPPENKVSVKKQEGVFAIFFIIFYGLFFFTSVDQERNPISPFQIMVWIIFGLTFGVISSLIMTKYQLSRVSKAYQFTANMKNWALITIFSYLVSSFLYALSQLWWSSAYAWGISFSITRIILLVSFERKENMRLMTSWWGPTIFLVPKPPTINTNRLEMDSKRDYQV
jgi:hypothetical protein